MRGTKPRRPLPTTVPARPTPVSKLIHFCQTCDNGYRVIERTLSVLNGRRYWTKHREAEALHGHFFLSSAPATQSLIWQEHCEHCHEAGEAL